MKEVKIYSTIDQIEDLKASIVWSDITRELESWVEGFDLEMRSITDDAAERNPSTASVLLHMGDLNGRTKAVDYMLNLLDVFISILEVKKDDTRRKSTD